MANIEQQIKRGENLLEVFCQLDKRIVDWGLLQDSDNRAILIDDIKHFNKRSEKYIDNLRDEVDGDDILTKSREHEYVNDHEVGNLALSEFYSYGIAIKQIVKELNILVKGSRKDKRKYNGKFYYSVEEKVVYRNKTDLPIKSRQLKRETLCEMIFKYRGKWIEATDIESKRAKKYGGTHYEIDEPYEWIRKACDEINEKIKEVFNIDYELFEKENQKVRLNTKAK